MRVNIEDAREEMLGQIEEIEKLCFSVPWTLEQLRSQLKDPQHEFIAALDPEGRVLGYVGTCWTRAIYPTWPWPRRPGAGG